MWGCEALDTIVEEMAVGRRWAISLAPSFPAAFYPAAPAQVVARLRMVGFIAVEETAVVLPRLMSLRERLVAARGGFYISSSCPAVVTLIERKYPDLRRYVLPLPSPMAWHGRLLKERYGKDTRVLFAGPCGAKKKEAALNHDAVDCAVTFRELSAWLEKHRPAATSLPCEDVIAAADMTVARAAVLGVFASGREEITELFSKLPSDPPAPFLEVLACPGGCLNGPGMPSNLDLAQRRAAVLEFTGL